jgi:hypothetical protein
MFAYDYFEDEDDEEETIIETKKEKNIYADYKEWLETQKI